MNEMSYVNPGKVKKWMCDVLATYGVSAFVQEHLSEALVQTSMRGVDSHGVRLFPHYINALQAGRINGTPNFVFEKTAAGTGRLDGDHTYGHAAGSEGMFRAVELARDAGIGAVAVYNSSHFGAAAYYAFHATDENMIGLSFTQTDALIVSPNGVRAFLGNSPLCFAAPVAGENPVCVDMATSVVPFNKIKSYAQHDKPIPAGWGVDRDGKETLDSHAAVALVPTGGYKGFCLSFMVEVLCSLLTGTKYGPDILRMFADPIEEKRRLGHFYIAIDIARFVELDVFKIRIKEMMDRIRQEPAVDDEDEPVMCPGDPEKKKFSERVVSGIPFSLVEVESLCSVGDDAGISFACKEDL